MSFDAMKYFIIAAVLAFSISLPFESVAESSVNGVQAEPEIVFGEPRIVELGGFDGRIPSLENIQEFQDVVIQSNFGFLDNFIWALKMAFMPSLYEEIVPIYGYSPNGACNSQDRDDIDWDSNVIIRALTANSRNVKVLTPGALYIQTYGSDVTKRKVSWYESLDDACSNSNGQDVELNHEFLDPIFKEIDNRNHIDIIVTSLPLWEVEEIDRFWGICDINKLSGNENSACRMQLEDSAFHSHQNQLTENADISIADSS